MRTSLVLAGLASLAAALWFGSPWSGSPWLGPFPEALRSGAGPLPHGALFTFAVSAFRERLR